MIILRKKYRLFWNDKTILNRYDYRDYIGTITLINENRDKDFYYLESDKYEDITDKVSLEILIEKLPEELEIIKK